MHTAVHDSHPATGPVMAKMVKMLGVRPIKVNGMWDEDESLGTVEWNVDDNNKGDHTTATDDSQNGMMLGTKT